MANKRLDIIKQVVADRNEGKQSPFLNTQRKQGYTGRSVPEFRGGKTPGGRRSSGKSANASSRDDQRNDAIKSGQIPLLPNNTIAAREDFDNEHPPRVSGYQSAEVEKRFRDYYADKTARARKDAGKKRLKRGFNGSAGQSIIGGRGRVNGTTSENS